MNMVGTITNIEEIATASDLTKRYRVTFLDGRVLRTEPAGEINNQIEKGRYKVGDDVGFTLTIYGSIRRMRKIETGELSL